MIEANAYVAEADDLHEVRSLVSAVFMQGRASSRVRLVERDVPSRRMPEVPPDIESTPRRALHQPSANRASPEPGPEPGTPRKTATAQSGARGIRIRRPLIDLQLFRLPGFGASLATNTLSLFVAFGTFLFIAQYLQLVLGLSPLQAGVWTLPSSGGFIAGSMLAPVLVRRVHPAFVIAAGLALAAVGLGALTQVDRASGLAVIVIGSVVLALGIAPAVTLGTDLIVGTAPPERAGAASAISETGTELGGALDIAILGSIGAAIYRTQVAHAVPAGVSPHAAQAARDTLGGAVAAAHQLPGLAGAELLDRAREAFTQGLQLSAGISAASAIAMAVLAAVLLRHVGAESEHHGQPDLEPGAAITTTGVEKIMEAVAETAA